jgi:phage shock protein C
MDRKLYRSRSERMVAGVCGGIAEYYEMDPTLIRLIAVLLTLVSLGTALIAYIVMAIVIPEAPTAVSTEGGAAMPTTPQPPQAGPGSVPPQASGVPTVQPYYAPVPPPAPETPRPRGRGGVTFGLVLVFVGLAVLAAQFVPGLDIWKLWPLIIVAIGIRTMFRGGD